MMFHIFWSGRDQFLPVKLSLKFRVWLGYRGGFHAEVEEIEAIRQLSIASGRILCFLVKNILILETWFAISIGAHKMRLK
jgi:hypothetical protein